jgi:TonB-linked SusC/RagA family outer membrane protein
MNYSTFYKAVVPRYGLLRKTLLVMKITTLILLMALMQVSAASVAQRITFVKKNASLEQVFQEIIRQTGYEVFYGDKKFDDSRKINAAFKEATLEEVLKTCLQNQRASYVIEDKSIIIKPASEPTFLERLANRWAAIDVHGRVVDSENRPLPGASVKVKTTSKAVSTNAKGEFYLEKVDEGAVLVISFIGYVSKEVVSGKEMGEIVLELSDSKLDEVQVIAYGTTSQRLSTGNVSTVKAADIAKQPVNNPILALQGRVPGIQITQATGFAGSGVDIQIQGQNSFNNGSAPFYVVDGVPYTQTLLSDIGGILGTSGRGSEPSQRRLGSPLSYINPADIESIDVLKDADATAIYGSRAANGAVIITTKKGKAGKLSVDFNLQTGIGQVARNLKFLNTAQYLEMRKEAKANDNTPFSATDYDLNGTWDPSAFTDWQKELLGNNAHYNDAQLNLSGGNANTQYSFGAGYHKETTVFKDDNDHSDGKASVRFNLNSMSGNEKFHFTFSGNYVNDNNRLPVADITAFAMKLPPNAPPLLNNDGSINWARNNAGNSTLIGIQPLAFLTPLYRNNTNNLISNATLSYQLLKGLELKSSFGYTNLQSEEVSTSPSTILPPEFRSTFFRTATYGTSNIKSWIIEPQISFKQAISRGSLNALLGATIQQNNNNFRKIVGTGYSDDLVLENINAATNVSVPIGSTIQSMYKYNAVFARINYNWEEKYILNLSGRRDGSSRFGAENRFHNFWALGAAWLFSNEKIIKDNAPFLSFGKLKVSYGTTGNDQIGDYTYLRLYNYNNPVVPYRGAALVISNLSNPFLQWEETRKFSTGMDLGFLKDRILLNANFYLNRSSNLILNQGLPNTAGITSLSVNLPARIQNSGWELALHSTNIKTDGFNWSTSFNMTMPKNKVLSYNGLDNNTVFSGYSLSTIRAYRFNGVNPATGLYEFLDKNGKAIDGDPSSNPDDRTVFINQDQKFYGGFSNTFSYKGISLDVLFQFVKQLGQDLEKYGNIPGFGKSNQRIGVLDRWQKAGDMAPVQRYFTNVANGFDQSGYLTGSDAIWEDASYIRLKNISLSWDVPKRWLAKYKLQSCRLFIHGQNLLTITSYTGLDPETKSSLSLPPLRVTTIGIQASL